jgi:FtsH-binding integral membrane protein
MSYDPFRQTINTTTASGAVDMGLQAHMRGVYNTMGLGLVVTGLTAWLVASVEPLRNLVFGPLFIVFALAPLGILMFGFTPAKMQRWPAAKIRNAFYLFSAIMGISMGSIFLSFTMESIARVFFITAGAFAATSLYGYTTKRDLTGMGSFMVMGLIGLVLASVVNLFLGSAMVQFVTSAIGVVVFTGLTAWETQRIKESYAVASGMAEANAKMAVMGALSLYMSFINLFQVMMHFMGHRE